MFFFFYKLRVTFDASISKIQLLHSSMHTKIILLGWIPVMLLSRGNYYPGIIWFMSQEIWYHEHEEVRFVRVRIGLDCCWHQWITGTASHLRLRITSHSRDLCEKGEWHCVRTLAAAVELWHGRLGSCCHINGMGFMNSDLSWTDEGTIRSLCILCVSEQDDYTRAVAWMEKQRTSMQRTSIQRTSMWEIDFFWWSFLGLLIF